MTMLRFLKERARQIIFDQDPGFKVISFEQMELKDGVYLCRPVIKELLTGKYFTSCFRVGTNSFDQPRIRPYENDEPVFEEIEYQPETSDMNLRIIGN